MHTDKDNNIEGIEEAASLPSDTAGEEKKEEKNSLYSLFEFVELFAIAACVILLVFTMLARLTVVSGGSMDDTLADGELLIVSDLFYKPENGDIVIVQSPEVLSGKAIVKRIIATEGQRVEIQADGVYVYNPDGTGGKLEESDGSLGYTVSFAPSSPSAYKYHRQTIIVGEGEVFVMGDHRSVSEDSRSFGCVDERCIVGKAYFRVTPFDRIGFLHHN